MFGKGLATGLEITLKELFTPKVTIQYPEERAPLPARFHGRFTLDKEACIACGLCQNACPNRVINCVRTKVDKKNVLTGYHMDIQYCLFCGLCVEACPKGALRFSQDFEMACYHRENVPLVLLAEGDRPACDVSAAGGKEVKAGD
ncbi:MAG: NADH-quinone oxidoreductase subunit I [Peptococcaceae bacterium]|jgi:NADH-quinone oxidoreductase subunit I|nr:NADH-quinone oxidoreductase subunit I [Peptococcaceae bacterium]